MDKTTDDYGPAHGERGLGHIEMDLCEAEKALFDAEAKLDAAKRERSAALEKINKHQSEIDEAIAERRRHSTPGTKWHREETYSKDTLDLSPEDIADKINENIDGPAFKIVSGKFNRQRDGVNKAE